ncbi:DsbA family protein [Phenylobacterium sp. 58.2.17]|uniref:DsbA family protein n=1 Tax=Phenylobacterium sp. 58.2.17 TaxID=2969306 RepID=UPI002264129C|nr:DsbA family protein [Phenylobacterium sp. 58.2.17]MCX7585320.1 DsbA family protein [Phenylobacterium sp. 58.2.17]
MLQTPPTPLDHRRGDADAVVVLVEYGDYQCPHCAAAQEVVESLFQTFDTELQLVFRHFPLSTVHPYAEVAAQAAEFAGAHNAFWRMHETLFANQPQLSVPTIFAIAEALHLPEPELREALDAGTFVAKIRADFIGGVRSGVNGTPCFFVNGLRHNGDYSFESLSSAIFDARGAAGDWRPPSPSPRPAL